MNVCLECGLQRAKYTNKYCSNQCQSNHRYSTYIETWKHGGHTGTRGIRAKNLSQHIIRYIMDKYDRRCARCDWNELNPITGKVTLEIDHIDGNSENNNENNLILLCPNCHSLTPNYKNLNKGNGRAWRREKYVKIVEVPL